MPQPAFSGSLPSIGSPAPQLRYVKVDRTEGSLADHRGHALVLLMFPSVDTSTCATETRSFNKLAVGLGARVLAITADLHYALKRFCAAEGIDHVDAGSDFRYRDVDALGTRIAEGNMNGLLGRVTFVIDQEGVVRYCEVAPELGAGSPRCCATLSKIISKSTTWVYPPTFSTSGSNKGTAYSCWMAWMK